MHVEFERVLRVAAAANARQELIAALAGDFVLVAGERHDVLESHKRHPRRLTSDQSFALVAMMVQQMVSEVLGVRSRRRTRLAQRKEIAAANVPLGR